ncbi:MAG TPA: hypothetical protein VN633_20665 [Bryobacteraceae bacterium]|nr:hypothetical protein [Bryobacteraceae bacterium]
MPPRSPDFSRRNFLAAAPRSVLLAAALNETLSAREIARQWSTSSGGYRFTWDIAADKAAVHAERSSTPVWTGGLLPAIVLGSPSSPVYSKAAVDFNNSAIDSSAGRLSLMLGKFAKGELRFEATEYGVAFSQLTIEWAGEARPVVSVYFGISLLTPEEQAATPILDTSFWPNWDAACFSVPGAKGAPLQSVFRRWDLGNANLPLGSFGPSLGTPYAAAYPRPLYAAAMGNQDGWVCLGSGAIPDGALSLRIQSSSACLNVLYREDLWGTRKGKHRVWPSPLRISWARDPWQAYQKMFASFETRPVTRNVQLKTQWNSWGDFRKNNYDLRALADWTADVGAEIVGLDDRWESFTGSGEPDRKRFPAFDDDMAYIKAKGLSLGFWQPVGWVDDPKRAGLSHNDLILGKDGTPRRAAWDTNPRSRSHFCLDPSAPGAIRFLRGRTTRLMEKYQPALLKLDFGYGLPSPNAGVPRDPALRGERYSLRLLEVIAESARSIDPDVAIEYYSLHPFVRRIANVIALDDLGDAGAQEAAGHRQWSIWAALGSGTSIMASSGYDWNADSESVLDSAVIGVPGAVLSRTMDDGSPVPRAFIYRRKALNCWYRRSIEWSPLWLNSSPGGYLQDPIMRCFGRLERVQGESRLTALTLREQDKHLVPGDALRGTAWHGNWALIAQDDEDIFRSRRLACMPVDGTFLELPRRARPQRVIAVKSTSEEPWSAWNWADGRLRISVEHGDAELLGIVVLE